MLANEQVIDGKRLALGRAGREAQARASGSSRSPHFAEELLDGLGKLDELARQGPADAGELDRQEPGPAVRLRPVERRAALEVYTTRPDTIFGASFVAVAPDHPLAQDVAATNCDAAKFIEQCKRGGTTAAELETAEKLGFDTGIGAMHPFTGEHLPVFIANFVLMDYGTGAIMAVPGHDQRDFEFATKYGLPISRVVAASGRRGRRAADARPKRATACWSIRTSSTA